MLTLMGYQVFFDCLLLLKQFFGYHHEGEERNEWSLTHYYLLDYVDGKSDLMNLWQEARLDADGQSSRMPQTEQCLESH